MSYPLGAHFVQQHVTHSNAHKLDGIQLYDIENCVSDNCSHYTDSASYILFNDHPILVQSSVQLTGFVFLLFQVSANDKHEWLLPTGILWEGIVTACTLARREGVLYIVPLSRCLYFFFFCKYYRAVFIKCLYSQTPCAFEKYPQILTSLLTYMQTIRMLCIQSEKFMSQN